MEHPLIGSLDTLSEEELNAKISELNNKLNIATRSGNQHLCNQIRMALESYQNKYKAKIQEATKKQEELNHINFDDKIQIK